MPPKKDYDIGIEIKAIKDFMQRIDTSLTNINKVLFGMNGNPGLVARVHLLEKEACDEPKRSITWAWVTDKLLPIIIGGLLMFFIMEVIPSVVVK